MTSGRFRHALTAVSRRRNISSAELNSTELNRCLSVWELTLLGIGSTIGSGLYVISGQVAREQAGPAIIISYTIAAIACLFSAICYAEFAVRLPRAGGSYVYCYVAVGELLAFVVGWNVIFENIIGFASVAKAWSNYLDSFTNDTIRSTMEQQVVKISIPGFDTFIDFVAFGLVIFFTIIAIIGVRITSVANTTLTIVNIVVSGIVIVAGAIYAKPSNWTSGKFAPYGATGVLAGAGRCFYAMIGFDTIASSSEEVSQKKTIPTAMLLTLFTCYILYFGTSAVLTLMVPWDEIDTNAPLAKAFQTAGAEWAQNVIGVGALCALSASILGSIFAAARTTYSMAHDGLIFSIFSRVASMSNTPILATVVVGFLGAVLSMFFDISSLVEMTSIGTLLAYTLVCVSTLVIHYQPYSVGDVALANDPNTMANAEDFTQQELTAAGNKKTYDSIPPPPSDEVDSATFAEIDGGGGQRVSQSVQTCWQSLSYLLCKRRHGVPTAHTAKLATVATFSFCISTIILSLVAVNCYHALSVGASWAVVIVFLLSFIVFLHFVYMYTLPKNETKLHYAVPLIPLWPMIALLLNISIMVTLSWLTWVRFVVWQIIGFIVYFGYGITHSIEDRITRAENEHEMVSPGDLGALTSSER